MSILVDILLDLAILMSDDDWYFMRQRLACSCDLTQFFIMDPIMIVKSSLFFQVLVDVILLHLFISSKI